MVDLKIDVAGLVEAAKKDLAKADKGQETAEILKLIDRAGELGKTFQKSAERMEKERQAGIKQARFLKKIVRDLYREIDTKIAAKPSNPLLERVLKTQRTQFNDLWIKLDKLEKDLS